MGTSDKMLGGNLQWTSIPSRGSSNTCTPSWLHAMETGIRSRSVGQLCGHVCSIDGPFEHFQVTTILESHETRTENP